MSERQVTCTNCNTELTITEPATLDDWDPIAEMDPETFGREFKVTGHRIIFRCWSCHERSAIIREVDQP